MDEVELNQYFLHVWFHQIFIPFYRNLSKQNPFMSFVVCNSVCVMNSSLTTFNLRIHVAIVIMIYTELYQCFKKAYLEVISRSKCDS